MKNILSYKEQYITGKNIDPSRRKLNFARLIIITPNKNIFNSVIARRCTNIVGLKLGI